MSRVPLPSRDGGAGLGDAPRQPAAEGEDLGDPYGAKEGDLKGFVGTGVPWAARVTGWRHEVWGQGVGGCMTSE